MANKNRTMLILGVILLVAIMAGQEKKEASISPYVNPGSSVGVLGELSVKSDATSWLIGEPTKVHWQICTTPDCIGSTVISGFEQLTSAEIGDLNNRFTSAHKTTSYSMNFVAPANEGYYYYQGTAETSQGLRVQEINVDGFIINVNGDITFHQGNKFYVLQGAGCSDYTDNEIVDIPHGTISVTINHDLDTTTCIERTRSDIGFQVICDSGYTANVNGRQSTCTLTTQPPSTFDYRCVGSTINQVVNSNLVQIGTCNEGQVCGDAGVAKPRDVTSTTELTLSWLAGTNGGICTTVVGCTPDNSCAINTCTTATCVNNCGASIQGTKDCGTVATWSPLTSSKACGESFNQTSNLGATRLATGIACEEGTCNLETSKCEEEGDDEFNFEKYLPIIIIFFAFIIGIKMLKSP